MKEHIELRRWKPDPGDKIRQELTLTLVAALRYATAPIDIRSHPHRRRENGTTGVEPTVHCWRETVENGVHELHRDFGGVTLTIGKLDFPDAWACFLPDGKRVVGDLRTVRETVERIMNSCGSAKSSAT